MVYLQKQNKINNSATTQSHRIQIYNQANEGNPVSCFDLDFIAHLQHFRAPVEPV